VKVAQVFIIGDISIQDLVKDKEWQELRKSFIGTLISDAPGNVKKLRKFLGSFSSEKKLIIVQNYLTGTGFRVGTISHPDISKLLSEVKENLKKLRSKK